MRCQKYQFWMIIIEKVIIASKISFLWAFTIRRIHFTICRILDRNLARAFQNKNQLLMCCASNLYSLCEKFIRMLNTRFLITSQAYHASLLSLASYFRFFSCYSSLFIRFLACFFVCFFLTSLHVDDFLHFMLEVVHFSQRWWRHRTFSSNSMTTTTNRNSLKSYSWSENKEMFSSSMTIIWRDDEKTKCCKTRNISWMFDYLNVALQEL